MHTMPAQGQASARNAGVIRLQAEAAGDRGRRRIRKAWMGGMAGLSRRCRDGFEVGVWWLREPQG
jgi:hypothetical protein